MRSLQGEFSARVEATRAALTSDIPRNRGFLRDDLFVCVHEQFMTETAMMADIVLPATMATMKTGWPIASLVVAEAIGRLRTELMTSLRGAVLAGADLGLARLHAVLDLHDDGAGHAQAQAVDAAAQARRRSHQRGIA